VGGDCYGMTSDNRLSSRTMSCRLNKDDQPFIPANMDLRVIGSPYNACFTA